MINTAESERNERIHHKEGNMFKFVPCKSCEMYRRVDPDQFDFIKQCCSKNGENIQIHCISCQEKNSLLAQIDDLNNTIFNLNERVSSLIHIRNGEQELDTTVENLGQNFSNMHISNNDDTIPPVINEEVVEHDCIENDNDIEDSTNAISDTSNVTSVWSDSDQVPVLTTSSTYTYNNDTSNKITLPDDLVSDANNSLNNQTIPNESTEQHNSDIIKGNKVILAGDKALRNVKLTSFSSEQEVCLKIAPYNTEVNELAETIHFFLEKMHENVQFIVLQLSNHDCIYGKTEIIKRLITDLSHKLFGRG